LRARSRLVDDDPRARLAGVGAEAAMTMPGGVPGPRVVPDGTVAYGIQLPVQAQSRLFAQAWELEAGPAEMQAVARQADASGFLYVGVCDHTAIPRRLARAMGTTWYDPVATLAWVAGFTERVRLLTHVYLAALRHPLRAAKELATLDRISGGRLIVGVGTGHVIEELEILGTPYAARGRRLDEAIDALGVALVEEFPIIDGPTWRASDLAVAPRPVQSPRPPIWVGGSTEAALRRAAARGDGWLPQGSSRQELPEQIATLCRLRDELAGGAPIEIGTITEWLYVGTPRFEVPPGTLAGSPEALAGSLEELVAMGVCQLQVRFPSRGASELCDQMAAFAEQVAPLLGAGG
jgi:probable F420-dependent oxidoreductase